MQGHIHSLLKIRAFFGRLRAENKFPEPFSFSCSFAGDFEIGFELALFFRYPHPSKYT